MEIWKDLNISLNVDDVLRGEGTDPTTVTTKRPMLAEVASKALREGNKFLHPIAIIQEFEILEHGHERIVLEGNKALSGSLITRHFSGARNVVLSVCSIGAQLENLVTASIKDDPLFGFALDGFGNAAVEKVSQQVCKRIGELAEKRGFTTSSPLSPGEPDWSVETGQLQIFSLLDAAQAGITLSSGGMMIPKKSISFVVGIGENMSQVDQCQMCNFKERCHYHHA